MRRLAFLSALAYFCSVSGASAETWTWFRSVTTNTEWSTTRGTGDVDLSGGVFRASLRDGDDELFVRLLLRGSIAQGSVRARVEVRESDSPIETVSGRLNR